MATGNAKVCGVIGNPVGHSLSPLMHNEIAKALGLDYIYVPCPVAETSVGDAVRGAYALGFAGLNVTVPYKQRVIPYLAETDESVRCIGACNTLVRLPESDTCNTLAELPEGGASNTLAQLSESDTCNTLAELPEGDAREVETAQAPGQEDSITENKKTRDHESFIGYKGYNTDAEGLFRAMREQGMEIRGRECLLIGAGGAARAAAYLLVREKAESVTILNRSTNKAEALAADMRKMMEENTAKPQDGIPAEERSGNRTAVSVLPLERWKELPGNSYLAVQTTSVGMYPHMDAAPIEDGGFYQKIAQAVDVIYTPSETRFMKYVRAAGGSACGGLDMLIYQGVAALELWNPGVKVPREVVDRVRRSMEEQLHG